MSSLVHSGPQEAVVPTSQAEKPRPGSDPALDSIFCAALAGFVGNKDFHGPVFQGSAQAAVEFASEVVAILSRGAIEERQASIAEYLEREAAQ